MLFCDRPENVDALIGLPNLRRLLAEWLHHRNSLGRIPGRAQFPPEALRYILGNLFLMEIEGEGEAARYRYRIFGSNFIDGRGYDLTGRYLDEHPDEHAALHARHAYRIMQHKPYAMLGRRTILDTYGLPLQLEVLVLPLADEQGRIRYFLGGQYHSRIPVDQANQRRGEASYACAPAAILLEECASDPDLRRLLMDWENWRGDRHMPSRNDFRPETLGYLLGRLMLLDLEPGEPPRLRFRLVGSDIVQNRGFDLTGRLLEEHPDPAFAKTAPAIYAQVLATRQPLWVSLNLASEIGLPYRLEALILPLSSDGETIDKVLSAQVSYSP
ncbi:PAS domain-containing protein [Ferrovibrio sp.]|uniref:PAS domain-containing protein n=1 Tax=Ferrovibrio sp. TaxID=1917215 RepID=UPI0025BBF833|nr:PAS domain-containing protein [Ferrovibrio sp.]MBX3453874.1 PAS domain-containing protein [Ferrovibrio sp.]